MYICCILCEYWPTPHVILAFTPRISSTAENPIHHSATVLWNEKSLCRVSGETRSTRVQSSFPAHSPLPGYQHKQTGTFIFCVNGVTSFSLTQLYLRFSFDSLPNNLCNSVLFFLYSIYRISIQPLIAIYSFLSAIYRRICITTLACVHSSFWHPAIQWQDFAHFGVLWYFYKCLMLLCIVSSFWLYLSLAHSYLDLVCVAGSDRRESPLQPTKGHNGWLCEGGDNTGMVKPNCLFQPLRIIFLVWLG